MKIAYFVGEFPKLSESFIVNQIAGMVKLGHDVTIFAIKKGDIENAHPSFHKYALLEKTKYLDVPDNKMIRIVQALANAASYSNGKLLNKSINNKRYGKYGLSLYNFYLGLEFQNHKYNFDILHCYYGGRGIYGLFLKDIGVKGKLVVTFVGGDLLSKESKYYSSIFEKASKIIAITPFVRDKLIELGCPKSKIQIIGMGTDTDEFKPPKYGFLRPNWLLSVGRLAPEKGFMYSIKAVKKLLSEGYDLRYNIIGNGKEYQNLKKIIGKNKNISLHRNANQKQLIAMYQLSDLFILPSVSGTGSIEGQGVVLQEAQSCGLPVIASDIGGISSSLINWETGCLVPEKDPKALAEAIKALLDHPKYRAQFGKAARKFVKENYDLVKLNKRLSDLYKSL